MKQRSEVRRWLAWSIFVFTAFAVHQGEVKGSENINFCKLEWEVVEELNSARTNPRFYASHLNKMRGYFHPRDLRQPGAAGLVTREGEVSVVEAIRFLENANPLPALRLSRGMSRGARDHVEDQRKTGIVGHVSTEGAQPWERISRHGTWKKMVGENISYGKSQAREVTASLIIDDGVPGRGHRGNIFNPNFRVVGVAWGPHPIYGTMCVIVFAGEYLEKKKENS